MPIKDQHEQKFFKALGDIFVGAKIEGDSGFINLMAIKSRYYQTGVFPLLKKDIDNALVKFPEFREELFDKLYTFFQRYFSESGSIYFRYTSLHQNVYEKVYTDDRDVILFWKTHMLYYVKTDRIFRSVNVEVEGTKFFFDASKISLKKANEKREVIYAFRKLQGEDGTLVFDVDYSERGRVTKVDEILKETKKAGHKLSEDILSQAFRIFEKQSEVDFFINKDAQSFLQEQFDLWMYQYLFDGQNIWSAERIAQLQALKEIAYKVIGFISQFEDELVRIWNKPKFVLNSHYVLTLDKIFESSLFEHLLNHPNLPQQVEEWRELSMLDDNFRIEMLTEKDLTGELIYDQCKYLPLDTKYFPDMELEIIEAFSDLDEQLDGWVIHSENYQALTTLLPKFKKTIECIHIDPPYNTDTSGFLYANTYLHSSWLTMMENRINLSLELLNKNGAFLCHIDENEYERLGLLLKQKSISTAGTVIWDKRNPMLGRKGIATQHEYIIWSTNQEEIIYLRNDSILEMINYVKELIKKFGSVKPEVQQAYSFWIDHNEKLSGGEKSYRFLDDEGRIYQSVGLGAPEPRVDPKFFKPLIHPVTGNPCPVPANGFSRTPETLQELIRRNEIIFGEDETTQPRRKLYLTKESRRQLSSVVQDSSRGKMDMVKLGLDFPYCHPVSLYEKIMSSAVQMIDGNLFLDYFAGSGTTAHAVMNLNREDGGRRKYILVEMGEHFNTVILPRIKKVAFNSKWKDGKPVFVKGEGGMSHFVKYYDLEQYEDVLKRARYEDTTLFENPGADPYHNYVFLRDLKMLDSVEMKPEENQVLFHPEWLYPDSGNPNGTSIDLAETLSQRTGKWIKRITADYVEFQDGERLSLTDPDWQTIKPLVWWQ